MSRELDINGLQTLLWTFTHQRVVTAAARTGILRRLAESEATIRSWMEAAGLRSVERTDLTADRWIISGRAA